MLQTNDAIEETAYAIPRDFCRIFKEDMNALYWFSLLLTADREKAEQCFVSGLEDCVGENRVFKEWARSWARRAIVQNAIRMIRPTPEESGFSAHPATKLPEGLRNVSLAAVLALKPFERFVLVMSVLERYSDQECKTLLRCSRQDIAGARAKAMEQIARARGLGVESAAVHNLSPMRHEASMARSA